MIGNNELHFNEGTMKAIVQDWLTCNLLYPTEVKGIKERLDGSCKVFVISVYSKPQEISDDPS